MKSSNKIGLLLCIMLYSFSSHAQSTLSQEDRIFGLSKLWQEVNYNFAYFDQVQDLDWNTAYKKSLKEVSKNQTDLEYYKTLEQLSALLNDGHTNVYLPEELEKQLSFPKIEIGLFEEKFVVVNVCEKLTSKIPLGSEILSVNGTPVQDYFQEEVLPFIASSTKHAKVDRGLEYIFYGPKEETIALKVKPPAGKTTKIQLSRNFAAYSDWAIAKPEQKDFILQPINEQTTYVALNTFGNTDIISQFKNALPSLVSAKSIIIDLRNNGGGLSNSGLEIAKHLVQEDFIFDTKWKSRNHIASHKAWGSSELNLMGYKHVPEMESFGNMDAWIEVPADKIIIEPGTVQLTVPTVILTSSYTASAAEDFLVYLDGQEHITLMGTTTFGSSGQPIYFSLPGGGFARVCAKRDMYPDGREFVGTGIHPDIEVKPTLETVLTPEDETLLQAIAFLSTELQ